MLRPLIIISTALLVLGIGAELASLVYGPSRAQAGVSTPTATPCPTAKVPDSYHGAGCGTPTPTPTSNRPPAEPEIVLMVNGSRGWVNVVLGETVTINWVLSNRGQGWFNATIDDQRFDGLDGQCQLQPGMQCAQSTKVTFDTPGQFVDTVSVTAVVPPASARYDEASVRITVAPLGDFNCDGSTNSLDATWILQLNAGFVLRISNTCLSDVNHDRELDSMDAFLILQFDAGLITSFH